MGCELVGLCFYVRAAVDCNGHIWEGVVWSFEFTFCSYNSRACNKYITAHGMQTLNKKPFYEINDRHLNGISQA